MSRSGAALPVGTARDPPKTDKVLISRNGERFDIQGTAAPMIDSHGGIIGVVLVFKDVTDSRRMQKMMVHKATHDPLTGLVNRSEFEQRLEKSLQSAKDFENTHALLFLDLDQFKIVNDTAGHAAGDELLRRSRCCWPGSCAAGIRSAGSAATNSACCWKTVR